MEDLPQAISSIDLTEIQEDDVDLVVQFLERRLEVEGKTADSARFYLHAIEVLNFTAVKPLALGEFPDELVAKLAFDFRTVAERAEAPPGSKKIFAQIAEACELEVVARRQRNGLMEEIFDSPVRRSGPENRLIESIDQDERQVLAMWAYRKWRAAGGGRVAISRTPEERLFEFLFTKFTDRKYEAIDLATYPETFIGHWASVFRAASESPVINARRGFGQLAAWFESEVKLREEGKQNE